MDSTEEYVEFLNKVRRTIYIDNLSPAVTETVVKAAFNQFGDVASVEFIPTFMQPEGVPRAALVEMANITLAQRIITDMNTLSFMIGGLPRPVRAKPAQVEMFDNRPRKTGREIQYSWRRKKDPDFEIAKKIQNVVKRHSAEASFLLEQQLKEEESLAERQAETLRVNCKKLEAMGRVSNAWQSATGFADSTYTIYLLGRVLCVGQTAFCFYVFCPSSTLETLNHGKRIFVNPDNR